MGWFFLLLTFFFLPPDSLRDTLPEAPAERIRAILDAPQLQSAIWGIYVVDVHSGRVIYRQNASKPFVPASNFKLLTTAAALELLGPAFRYQTLLLFKGRVRGDTLMEGDLIIKGSGDPTFGSASFNGDPLIEWAQQLAARGIRTIRGRLIGDDRVFPETSYPPGWDVGYLSTEAFAAPSGGLVYRDNVVELWIDAHTQPGHPPRLYSRPSQYLRIENAARVHRRRTWTFEMKRPIGSRHVLVQGKIPYRYRGHRDLPVDNPTLFTVYAFKQALLDAGIDVRELTLADIDELNSPPPLQQAQTLFTYTSPPLPEIIRVINKESHNLFAEQLFLTMGKGNRKRAATRIRRFLKRAHISTTGLSIKDGSGLSRKNLVTPELLVNLLTYMYHSPFSSMYLASLAAGGEKHTTLENRLRGIPVQAKTGSLEFVRTLSGYVHTSSGNVLAFSVLVNHYAARSSAIRSAIDQIVEALSRMSDSVYFGFPVQESKPGRRQATFGQSPRDK